MKSHSIISVIQDEHLIRPFLGDDLATWKPWLSALRVLYGLPIKSNTSRQLIRECTGRDPDLLPSDGFKTALFLTGRRSGKSRMAAIIGAYEGVLAGHEKKLSKGERGLVPVICPTKSQGRIVKGYLRAIFETPLLAAEIIDEQKDGFTTRLGTRIEILAGDFRTVRGYTLAGAVVDEAAFFGVDEESKLKSDTELVRAIKPALATVGGRLIAISSPYARKGWVWNTYKKYHANDDGRTLVWNCPSRTMNPTLPQSVVDEALADDYAAAQSEMLGLFRDDVGLFLPREVIERLVVAERTEVMPSPNDKRRYVAFVDLSGGRGDDSALCISFREGRKIIIAHCRRWKSPHNPYEVIAVMAEQLRRFGIRRVTGDNYSAEFVAAAFEGNGIRYTKCDKPKSQLYIELLSVISAGEIELLDDELIVNQLAGLERRTRSGGRDIIDHPPGGHDDVSNVVAGAAYLTTSRMQIAGPAGF